MTTTEETTRCTRCSHVHSRAAWAALPIVRTLGPDDVRDYVVSWPRTATITVRACARCGTTLARLVADPHESVTPSAPAG